MELLEIGEQQWWKGSYLTVKFVNAWGVNTNIDVGIIGAIGTLDLERPAEKLGPVAHEFSVLAGANWFCWKTPAKVELLNKHFTVASYTGGIQDGTEDR